MDDAVRAHVDSIPSQVRRRDATTMIGLMQRATGLEPRLWGSIIGFGGYHYKYASGREGDAPAAGFAPRKAATVVYLSDGVGAHAEALDRLGPHTAGVGCVYIKDLAAVDVAVLEDMVAKSFATLTGGTYTKRAREGGANDVP
jgi:hypothetical protein